MKKLIVTSGQPFVDIDAIACSIAYCELLRFEGKNAQVVHTSVLNSSIHESVKKWGLIFNNNCDRGNEDFIIVDVSDKDHFEKFVNIDKVVEVFDHRYGYEKYWYSKLGKESHIEMVGSCATLIWEEYVARSKPLTISERSAKLLSTAIISNTLNFESSVTTKRDKNAFEQLRKFSNLPNEWAQEYFEEQEAEVLKDVESAIINDTKVLKPIIGQLELWNSSKFIHDHLKEIEKALLTFGESEWFFSSPSISEGKNYILTKSSKIKKLLTEIIEARFDGDIGTTKKLWLRKEIWKKIIQK